MAVAFAHSVPGQPESAWEGLGVHSREVAALAAAFASVFGWGGAAGLAGLVHDIGKLSPEFQAYIRGLVPSGGDHSSAGARLLLDSYGPGLRTLATIVAAHHAGLPDGMDFDRRMAGVRVPAGVGQLIGALPDKKILQPAFLPRQGAPRGFWASFLCRMLFSCLVDADFLATERFMSGARNETVARGGHRSLADLRDRLAAFMAGKRAGASATPLNALRADILDHAVARAALDPGLFTLTVPTGGGKTLTSLSFALEHAVRHGLRRVILVIPFSAIIEQSAAVFRDALGAPDDVLEHHASFDWEGAADRRALEDEGADGLAKLRRAAENWDVPIVVTTAVQFFESLFANRTSRCRKLHNIAGSVVILDEAQTLPLPLLRPCMAALDELARNYRTSVVLCTATQPALRRIDGFGDGAFEIDETRELAPDPKRLYAALKRVQVERLPDAVPDETITARFAEVRQMLCIVNSRGHAQRLLAAIRTLPGAACLTTLMCPRHRRMVLDRLRERLADGEPVRLVATSLIEAGVDIDLPEVWRAAAGLSSIAQAAGRCNREGKMQSGRVVVFEPADAKPPRDLRQPWEAAVQALRRHDDPLTLDAIRDYFRELYWSRGKDRDLHAFDSATVGEQRGILPALAERAVKGDFPYASIAAGFRMIESTMEPVIVPWRVDPSDEDAEELLRTIALSERPRRDDLRRLQQYVAALPRNVRDEWLARGVLRPVHPALGEAMLRFEDLSHYDPDTGVRLDDPSYRAAEMNVL